MPTQEKYHKNVVARLALAMYKLRLSIVSNNSVSYNAHSISKEPEYPAEGGNLSHISSFDRHSLDLRKKPLEQKLVKYTIKKA